MFESFDNKNAKDVALEKEPVVTQATGDSWQEDAVANFERSRSKNHEGNIEYSKIEQGDQVQKRFMEELFDASTDRNYVQSILTNLNEYGFTQNEFENVLKNVSKNQTLREEISKGGAAVEHLLYELGIKNYDNPDVVAALIFNNNERQRVIEKNQQELNDRIANNPRATEEEYRLGAYVEAIEPQVSDAVFELLRKGYSPFESGFLDLATGSQYIGLRKDSTINFAHITDEINKNFSEEDKKVFSRIRIEEQENRIQIILVPKVRTMSLGAWRLFWNALADSMPDISNELSKNAVIDNGLQGKRFRENQDKLRYL